MKFEILAQLASFIFLLDFIEMLMFMTKKWIGKRLHQVRAKNELATTITEKILETKRKNQVKLDKRRNVWHLFLRVL